jgi:hypothetical protein
MKGGNDVKDFAEVTASDVKKAMEAALREVEDIRNGKLPKRSYKETLNRVREKLEQ